MPKTPPLLQLPLRRSRFRKLPHKETQTVCNGQKTPLLTQLPSAVPFSPFHFPQVLRSPLLSYISNPSLITLPALSLDPPPSSQRSHSRTLLSTWSTPTSPPTSGLYILSLYRKSSLFAPKPRTVCTVIGSPHLLIKSADFLLLYPLLPGHLSGLTPPSGGFVLQPP